LAGGAAPLTHMRRGSGGSIGTPAALVSAALDALGPLGVTDVEMPLTSEQVWQRMREARGT